MKAEQFYAGISSPLVAALFRLARWLPRRLALALGGGLGAAAYHLAHRSRRRAREQGIERLYRKSALADLTLALGSCYPRRKLARIVRASFRYAGRSLMETLRIPSMSGRQILALVDADPITPIERALARGKGLIVLTAHLGAWELGGPCLAARIGLPMYAVAQRLRHAAYEELVAHVRGSYGLEVIHQETGARPILEALKRNRPVIFLGDIDMPQVNGIFVDFFGRPAWTPTGPALLARATGAAIVPCFITWNGLRHRGHVLPEIEPARTRDKAADIRAITLAWTRAVECMVRRYPEQWPWFHRRWRTRPPSEKPRTGGPGA